MDAAAVRDFARSCGFDLIGFADPHKAGISPDVAWCNSLIVLGYATPDDTLDVCFRVEYDGARKWSKWIYELLEARALRLCFELKDQGFCAIATRNGNIIDLKQAAVLSGLGALGKNNLLVTERFGSRVRLIAVFTDAPMPFNERLHIDVCSDCRLCIGACPLGALSENGFDREKCVGGRGGFDQPAEVLDKQKLVERHLSDMAFIQCIECMVCCPVGGV
jgi:ferredoxin